MPARAPRALLLALLLLAAPPLAPHAAACHVGAWDHGPTHRLALVETNDAHAGLYAHERAGWRNTDASYGCEGMTWQDRCTMPLLLGLRVVAPDRPKCLVGPWDAGAYVNDITVGTELLP